MNIVRSWVDFLRRRPGRWIPEIPALPQDRLCADSYLATRPIIEDYPVGRDTRDQSRRDAWAAHHFALAFFLSFGLNLLLAGTIASMLPLTRREPMLVTAAGDSNQLISVTPIRRDTEGLLEATKVWCREWVMRRYGVLPGNKAMSANIVWLRKRTTFKALIDLNGADNRDFIGKSLEILPGQTTQHLTRIVRIAKNALSMDETGQVTIDWIGIDRIDGVDEPPVPYRTILRFKLLSQEMDAGDITPNDFADFEILNPFGFAVGEATTLRLQISEPSR